MATRVLLCLLTVGLARVFGQDHALEVLIEDVARSARTAVGWAAEGRVATTDSNGKQSPAEQFRIAYRSTIPSAGRFEITTGASRVLHVCDGTSIWVYYPDSNSYIKVLSNQISECAFPINAWPPLRVTMHSPKIVAADRLIFEGLPRDCQAIRAPFYVDTPMGRTLELCIDRTSKLILRHRLEDPGSQRRAQTFTFTSVHRNPEFQDDVFQFHPPADAADIGQISWLDPIAQPREGVYRVSNEVTAPAVLSIVAPAPSGMPRRRAGGTVVLYAEISSEGVPQNIKIVRGLGNDGDSEVVEAVRKWRFEPGFKGGVPATVVVALAVNVRGI